METAEYIAARRFNIVDSKDRTRALIHTRSDGSPAIEFFDAKGFPALTLTTVDDIPRIDMRHGGSGAGVSLVAAPDGSSIAIDDVKGGAGIRFSVNDNNQSAVELFHHNRDTGDSWKALSLQATSQRTTRIELFGPKGPPSLTIESSATDATVIVRDASGNVVWQSSGNEQGASE